MLEFGFFQVSTGFEEEKSGDGTESTSQCQHWSN